MATAKMSTRAPKTARQVERAAQRAGLRYCAASMASGPQDANPICPQCRREILSRERVSRQHGEFVHFACYITASRSNVAGTDDAHQRERPLCLSCLASEFGLTSREVEVAVRELTTTTQFAVRFDVCWRCRERRVTLVAAPKDLE
jgi:hypothetical protein